MRSHLMWIKKLKTLNYFLCFQVQELKTFDPIWAQFPPIAQMPQMHLNR